MSDLPDGGPGVLVTFRDMYVELRQLTGELREMNSKLTAGVMQAADHEIRIRSLERWRYALPVSTVLALGSAVTALITLIHK